MDCWFQVQDDAERRLVRVAGSLGEANVPDLLMVCASGGRSVVLDLTDLLSVDGIAADALCRVRDAGAALVGAPRYIQLKLASARRAPDAT